LLAADRNRVTLESRIAALFDRRMERVHVGNEPRERYGKRLRRWASVSVIDADNADLLLPGYRAKDSGTPVRSLRLPGGLNARTYLCVRDQ
jgi:hypothetical protein